MATLRRVILMVPGDANYSGAQTGYSTYTGLFVAEDNGKTDVPKGRIKKMWVRVLVNSLSTSTTVMLMKNGADTSMSLSIGAGATGEFTTTGDVQVEDGDDITFKWTIGGTSGQSIGPRTGGVHIE